MVYNVIKFHNDTYARMAFFFKKDFYGIKMVGVKINKCDFLGN